MIPAERGTGLPVRNYEGCAGVRLLSGPLYGPDRQGTEDREISTYVRGRTDPEAFPWI
jgi:hypothetical protein